MTKKKSQPVPEESPLMLFADDQGNILVHPGYQALGMSGHAVDTFNPWEINELHPDSKLFFFPGCPPIGKNIETGEIEIVWEMKISKSETIPCNTVSAFLPAGALRHLLPAAFYPDEREIFPLWAYSAVGYFRDNYWSPATIVEYDAHWDPQNFNDEQLVPCIEEKAKKIENNRLFKHLQHCATNYHCFAAKNLFMDRWEAPLPISRKCNSRCLGCISLQPSTSGFCASHSRIQFTPTVDEIVEIALPHLLHAEDPIVSFGQGCEGEPLTEWELIRDSIKKLRNKTTRGVINLNSNGSYPQKIKKLCKAGLDSLRVSVFSFQEEIYNAYYKPVDYTFQDVMDSIKTANEMGIYTMVNYLIFPGVTDQEKEFTAFKKMCAYTGVKFIHLKNLNIDPDYLLNNIPPLEDESMGIPELIERIKEELPEIQIGYFNRKKELLV